MLVQEINWECLVYLVYDEQTRIQDFNFCRSVNPAMFRLTNFTWDFIKTKF